MPDALPKICGRTPVIRQSERTGDGLWYIEEQENVAWTMYRDGVWRDTVECGVDYWPTYEAAEEFIRSLAAREPPDDLNDRLHRIGSEFIDGMELGFESAAREQPQPAIDAEPPDVAIEAAGEDLRRLEILDALSWAKERAVRAIDYPKAAALRDAMVFVRKHFRGGQ